jgi:hypothetical protein
MKTDPNDTIVVYSTNDVCEALIIRDELHDTGIRCDLDGDSRGGFAELAETKLLVRAQDADSARHLIERRTTSRFERPLAKA